MSSLMMMTHRTMQPEMEQEPLFWGLSEKGRCEAEEIREELPSFSFVYSGAYRSAVETAYIVAAGAGVKWGGLRETLKDPELPVSKPEEASKFFNYPASVEAGRLPADMWLEEAQSIVADKIGSEIRDNLLLVASPQLLAFIAHVYTGKDPEELYEQLYHGRILICREESISVRHTDIAAEHRDAARCRE
ncbi:hypothetical protein [Alkalicoccus chagannorensis]|uniref:hypothetical protein n=1 Tax=Alkalicoccus chagannorensis TaxID=427072 RepID=UPI000422D8FA|nr:hypothetical protein [Alkalicoccus chagannorensis]